MEQFQIETAQNISISQNTAHLGERILAYLIDGLIIAAYIIVVVLILLSLDYEMEDEWALYLVMNLPAFLYPVLLETFMDGKTIGKSLMKLRVVKLDGSKPNFSSYLVRWVLRIFDISLSSGGVAILTILMRGKGQRIGDIAAGTTVISEKKRVSVKDTLLQELADDYKPQFPQVTVFKDRDMQTIKELYTSAKRKGNHNVILSLSNRIKDVTQIKTDLKPIEFVSVVIDDYSYYTQEL
jgi:uncharacterized RDD family membrane protein YckC